MAYFMFGFWAPIAFLYYYEGRCFALPFFSGSVNGLYIGVGWQVKIPEPAELGDKVSSQVFKYRVRRVLLSLLGRMI